MVIIPFDKEVLQEHDNNAGVKLSKTEILNQIKVDESITAKPYQRKLIFLKEQSKDI